MSKHTVRSGDVAGLRARFSQLKDKVQVRTGQIVPIIVIQEAGLDGFWIHRLLQDEGVESHVVDTGSPGAVARPRLPQNVALRANDHETSESEEFSLGA